MAMGNTINSYGLALSGGGVRAAAFHAGVLKYLAEQKILQSIKHISSVSGGTLFVGLLLKLSSCKWPTNSEYEAYIFPSIRCTMTSFSILKGIVKHLIICPHNWKSAFSRANILAEVIKHGWNINEALSDIIHAPTWTINGTTSETGRRFRFKVDTQENHSVKMGDYEIGYADASHISLAAAMAVSAAFPVGIGPLTLNPKNFSWMKETDWNSGKIQAHTLPYKQLNLYDGGLYDNLGIEPLFDIGSQKIKTSAKVNSIIVSDAGAPYSRINIPHMLNPKRMMRINDIITDQTRALRIRAFINFVRKANNMSMYAMIGSNPYGKNIYGFNELNENLIKNEKWMSSSKINYVRTFPTCLHKLSVNEFDLISQHGYESMKLGHISLSK